jgi:hypothetical protein
MPWAAIQNNSALETNSGPLSLRKRTGAPRSLTKRDSTSITRGERMRPCTSLLAFSAAVEHEVVGPHLVRPRRRLWPRPARSHTLPRPFAQHLQTRCLPQPGKLALGSSRIRPVQERCQCADSQSADIAPPAPSSARSLAHPAPPSGFDSPTPIAPPKTACRPAAPRHRALGCTPLAAGEPARSPVF